MKSDSISVEELRELIEFTKGNLKKIISNRKFSKMSRRNVSYNLNLLEAAQNHIADRKSAVENVLTVIKVMLEMSEETQENKSFYRKAMNRLNGVLSVMNSDPQITRVQEALQKGTEKDRQMASSSLLSMVKMWKKDYANLVPVAFSLVNTTNPEIKRNIAGFFYFVSSNNPALIAREGLDLSTFAEDTDPVVRGISMLICNKTRDQTLLEKAFNLLQDETQIDLSFLDIPPETLHFRHVNLAARLSDIAREAVLNPETLSRSGSVLLEKCFTIRVPERTRKDVPVDLVISADPVTDLAKVKLDLSELATYFSVPSATVELGYIKAHEVREFPIRVIPTGTGWIETKIIVSNGRMTYDFPVEALIDEPGSPDPGINREPLKNGKAAGGIRKGGGKAKNLSSGHEMPPELIEKYSSPEFLGEGGFASVYKVTRNSDEKVIALKVPRIIDELTGESFMREVNAWVDLKHPNIVELFKANVHPVAHLEMEYMPGGGLDGSDLPIDLEDILRIGSQILSGLEFAHSRNRTHSDLKPSNILVDHEGNVKIGDWGLSRIGPSSGANSSFADAFTPAYAAPEEITPKEFGNIDNRTDIYQVGVILYELATGHTPFPGSSYLELTSNIIREEAPGFPAENGRNAAIESIVMKALSKHKEDRYQTAAEFREKLNGLLESSAPRKQKSSDSNKVSSVGKRTHVLGMCMKNLEILERDLDSRDGHRILSSLERVKSCVSKDKGLSDKIDEVIDSIRSIESLFSSIDDARYNMLKNIAQDVRNVVSDV